MLGLYFVPLMIDLANQSKQLEIDKKANQLLFEELHAKLIDDSSFSSYSIYHNRLEYKIYWHESHVTNQQEVCVTVEENTSTSLPKTEICIKPE